MFQDGPHMASTLIFRLKDGFTIWSMVLLLVSWSGESYWIFYDKNHFAALYHPCANKNQVNKLKALTRSCLYRHIITPYNLLSEDKPFALVAWGASLEFSVVDNRELVSFIKKYAKTGPEKVNRNGQYKQLLIEPASILTDPDDFSMCPNVKFA